MKFQWKGSQEWLQFHCRAAVIEKVPSIWGCRAQLGFSLINI